MEIVVEHVFTFIDGTGRMHKFVFDTIEQGFSMFIEDLSLSLVGISSRRK